MLIFGIMARKFYIFPHTDNLNMIAVENCDTPAMYITNNNKNEDEPAVVVLPVPPDFPLQINDCFKKGEMPVISF